MTRRLALVRSMGNDFLVASEASNLSMVERQLGTSTPRALAREALESGGASATSSRGRSRFSGLAAIATQRGGFERAATLVGAAEAIMEAQHMAWPPDERPHYERCSRSCPRRWGLDAFDGQPQPRSVVVGRERGRRGSHLLASLLGLREPVLYSRTGRVLRGRFRTPDPQLRLPTDQGTAA